MKQQHLFVLRAQSSSLPEPTTTTNGAFKVSKVRSVAGEWYYIIAIASRRAVTNHFRVQSDGEHIITMCVRRSLIGVLRECSSVRSTGEKLLVRMELFFFFFLLLLIV